MKHTDILKRAWKILWDYKALWVFGIILAITTASGGSSNMANNASNNNQTSQNQPNMEDNWSEDWNQGWEDASREFEQFFEKIALPEIVTTVVAIAVLVGCVIVFLIVISMIFRYMSEAALIQMVDKYEDTGEKISIREGFRLGFSRTAWKIFLADLVINLPLFLLSMTYVFLVMLPLLLLLTKSPGASILGVVTTIGLFFLGIFLAIVIFGVVSLLKRFFHRSIAIEGLGIFEAIRNGFQLVRQNLVDVGLMWLITFGLNLGFTILLIPIGLIVLVVAAIFGGGIGLVVGGLMTLAVKGPIPIIVGIIAGLPLFIVLMVVPLGFLDGLRETYMSTTWTLTYRETRALQSLDVEFLEESTIPDNDPGLDF
jgi:hypothetical protein